MGTGLSRASTSEPTARRSERHPAALSTSIAEQLPRPASALFGSGSRRSFTIRPPSRPLSGSFADTHRSEANSQGHGRPGPDYTGQRATFPSRSSRLATRARSSFTTSIPRFFTRPTSSLSDHGPDSVVPPPLWPADTLAMDGRDQESEGGPPQLPEINTDMPDFPSYEPPPRPSTPPRLSQPRSRQSTSMADRISALTPDRGLRALRRRRTPTNPAEQVQDLTQLLSAAAAATAATLMGTGGNRSITDLQNVHGIEGDNGAFRQFLTALREGRISSDMDNGDGAHNTELGGMADRTTGSLEFFRMFSFGNAIRNRNSNGNAESSRPSSSRSRTSRASISNSERDSSASGERMIPVLIVGIRALNPETDMIHNEGGDAMPSFLDALNSIPGSGSNQQLERSGLDISSQRGRSSARFGTRRRSSMTRSLNFLSPRSAVTRRTSSASNVAAEASSSTALGTVDGSVEPRPPPTTPSSASLPASSASSGTTTPGEGHSSAPSPTPAGLSPRRDSFIRRMTGQPLQSTVEEPGNEAARSGNDGNDRTNSTRLGSGSSRRNGVLVEPSDAGTENGSEGSRSWIIYVLGGSYPENHPILAAPSLFSDSPTYEDMMLLSTLLGPVKPPVADEDDLARAPGVCKIELVDGSLVASDADNKQQTDLRSGEKCLVCLCEYEEGEEARRLAKCGHLYHRECIETWLTTGRNSCPLCRGEGVEEKPAPVRGEPVTAEALA